MGEPLDRVAIEALKSVISSTLDALEEAEGFPLPWPVQKVVREQVTRAFEMGRTTVDLRAFEALIPTPVAPVPTTSVREGGVIETYADDARPTNPAPPKQDDDIDDDIEVEIEVDDDSTGGSTVPKRSGTQYRRFAVPESSTPHRKKKASDT
jgi:hypothetical protein